MTGLLIVNADDWGYDERTTDSILRAFRSGRISSATGMVYMADSDRAAELAARHGLPVGIHLNLTEPFSDPQTPSDVRDRQLGLIERLGKTSGVSPDIPDTAALRRWLYDPRIAAEVDRAITEQLARFVDLYGISPTHFDGHNHVDLCPNVFLSPAIPAGSKLRNSLYRFPVERSVSSLARAMRQAWRTHRLPSTRYLFHLRELRLAPGDMDPKLRLADRVPVEVMAHPGFARENDVLMSDQWAEVLRDRRLGSFADFAAAPCGWRESFRLLPPR